jgi:plastocyanin
MPEENTTNMPNTPPETPAAPEGKKRHTGLIIAGLILIVAAVVIALTQGGGNQQTNNEQTQNNVTETGNQDNQNSNKETGYIVTYTNDGFTPGEMTVQIGTTVVFNNASNRNMWVASAPHPTHTNYPEFDHKTGVGMGESYEFTFTRAGSWAYHNHLFPNHFGLIIVTE